MDEREKALDEFFRKQESSGKKKKDSEEKDKNIDRYFEKVAAKKSEEKPTLLDKIVDFFRITSFKNKFNEDKVASNKKRYEDENRGKFVVLWDKITQFFINRFSFEAGVDILDETSVLYRKNLVIRNIIWITNIVFILFVLIGSEAGNIKVNLIVTFAFFLVMFFTNRTTKRIIHQEPKTMQKQQLAEYISGVYILMMAISVYIKLRLTPGAETGTDFFSITQAGYSLIYFALVVIALYQDPKLLRGIFKVTIIVMTIIHVVILYPVYDYATDIIVLWNYVKGPVLTDIILRTLVLAVFMIALYSTAKISEDINQKRKEELIKRRRMEKDFKEVVSDVFDVISVYKRRGEENEQKMYEESARRVAELAGQLGHYLGYSPKLCKEIHDFSTIHIDKRDTLSLEDYEEKEVLDEGDFKRIREKTIVGSVIIKRLQLDKKAEDIVRAHFEKNAGKEFVKEMNSIQNNREAQVILLCHIYDILRQERNYKKELRHSRAVDLIQLEFYPYFDSLIVDRFVKYSEDFESMYYKLT